MIAFWIAAAIVVALALSLLLRPAFARRAEGFTRSELNLSVYRDQLRELEADLRSGTVAQEDYDRARRELEKRLLEEVDEKPGRAAPSSGKPARLRWFGVAAGIAVPLLALAIYAATGNPAALDPAKRQEVGAKEIEAMVQTLADRLAQNPDDVEGWKMLGKSYAVMGRFAEATKAYSKAVMLTPRDPQLLADLADSLAMARGQKMTGEPEELVLRALQLDPKNPKALALAGTAAYERADYRAAVGYWERMLPLVAEGSEDRRIIQANIDEARARSSAAPEKAQAKKKPGDKKQAGLASLGGRVTISPGLAAKVKPDDTLYIFARAAEGPPMPLAILRSRAGALPLKFKLDDSSSMNAQTKLSDVGRVVVVARVSKSGNAVPQAGDLQGTSGPVANNAQGLHIVIDTEVSGKPR